jgi:hypothetical protein
MYEVSLNIVGGCAKAWSSLSQLPGVKVPLQPTHCLTWAYGGAKVVITTFKGEGVWGVDDNSGIYTAQMKRLPPNYNIKYVLLSVVYDLL